jgi:hypothetical protein
MRLNLSCYNLIGDEATIQKDLRYLVKRVKIWFTNLEGRRPLTHNVLHHPIRTANLPIKGPHLSQVSSNMNWLIIQLALLTAVACQILFLKSTFYDAGGNIEHLFFWSVPLASLAAWLLERSLELEWVACFMIALIPTHMILNGFMQLISKILPDGILLTVLWKMSYWLFQRINCTLTKSCAVQ